MLRSHGNGELALGKRPQFLSKWAAPEGCLSVLTTRWLACSKINYPEDQGEAAAPFVIQPGKSHAVTSTTLY